MLSPLSGQLFTKEIDNNILQRYQPPVQFVDFFEVCSLGQTKIRLYRMHLLGWTIIFSVNVSPVFRTTSRSHVKLRVLSNVANNSVRLLSWQLWWKKIRLISFPDSNHAYWLMFIVFWNRERCLFREQSVIKSLNLNSHFNNPSALSRNLLRIPIACDNKVLGWSRVFNV